jgi:hypothetical protein
MHCLCTFLLSVVHCHPMPLTYLPSPDTSLTSPVCCPRAFFLTPSSMAKTISIICPLTPLPHNNAITAFIHHRRISNLLLLALPLARPLARPRTLCGMWLVSRRLVSGQTIAMVHLCVVYIALSFVLSICCPCSARLWSVCVAF